MLAETFDVAICGETSTERTLVERGEPGTNVLETEDDLRLLRLAADGDEGAFTTLMERHMARLYRLACSLVGNAADAEDVVQETMAGAYGGLKRFRAQASVKTWLTQILVRQSARLRRGRKRHQAARLEAVEATLDQETREGVERTLDVRAALARLSAQHRQVLVLREFEGMNYEEMAQVLGVPRGTIESRLHRARNELREQLKMYKQ